MRKEIEERDIIRDVLADYPQTRAIFNKHGLSGCGGPQGPAESIDYFAKAHGVDARAVVAELNRAIAGSGATPDAHEHAHGADECCTPPPPDQADTFYRRFLKAAIVLTLSVGATFGAVLLVYKALLALGWAGGNPALWWTAHVQVHAHVQLFGWIGLFIMGIAYHVVPRFNGTTLRRRDLAVASFRLLLAAILIRMYFQPLSTEKWAAHIVIWASGFGLAAAILYAVVLRDVRVSGTKGPQIQDGYLRWGTFWFLASSAATCAFAIRSLITGENFVPPLANDAFIHAVLIGFITQYILGVSLRTLPLFLGLNQPSPLVAKIVLGAINIGVALYAAGTLFDVAGLASSALILEALALVGFILHLGLFGRSQTEAPAAKGSNAHAKYIRAAYGWLFAAAVLVVWIAIEGLAGNGAPRDTIGLYRHMVTVGFASMMVMGMATKMIPLFEGRDVRSPLLVDLAFWLLNIGGVLRVISQYGVGQWGGAFHAMLGASGTLELTAFALFGINIWRTMTSLPAVAKAAPATDGPIGADMAVGAIVEKYPATLDVFLAHGFGHLKNPVFRATVAKTVSLRMACGSHKVDLEAMIEELKAKIGA